MMNDPREQSLAFIQENLAAAACYADAGHAMAAASDTVGLEYAIKKLVAHVKAAAGTTREVIDAKLAATPGFTEDAR